MDFPLQRKIPINEFQFRTSSSTPNSNVVRSSPFNTATTRGAGLSPKLLGTR